MYRAQQTGGTAQYVLLVGSDRSHTRLIQLCSVIDCNPECPQKFN